MTVRELITRLETFEDDTLVRIEVGEYGTARDLTAVGWDAGYDDPDPSPDNPDPTPLEGRPPAVLLIA